MAPKTEPMVLELNLQYPGWACSYGPTVPTDPTVPWSYSAHL